MSETKFPENIFHNLPDRLPKEIVETIIKTKTFRIERIVSTGQSSPESFWYDQLENEWVIVLKGHAKILFESYEAEICLGPGDFLNISAHTKHRVSWTDPDISTVWLAIFY